MVSGDAASSNETGGASAGGLTCCTMRTLGDFGRLLALSVTGTALAAGLSSAAWGAFVFVFACPSDDPLYIAVWYTIGCSIVTILGRTIFMRLSRW